MGAGSGRVIVTTAAAADHAGAKVSGVPGIIAVDAAGLLDPSGTIRWGTAWVNASYEIVIPSGYESATVFDISGGAVLRSQSATAAGIVRIEYQRSTGGAFSMQWAATVGYAELEAARADINDYYVSFTWHEDMLTGWKVRWRMLNSTDVSVSCPEAWIAVEARGTAPA